MEFRSVVGVEKNQLESRFGGLSDDVGTFWEPAGLAATSSPQVASNLGYPLTQIQT